MTTRSELIKTLVRHRHSIADAEKLADSWAFAQDELDMFFLTCYLRLRVSRGRMVRGTEDDYFFMRKEYWADDPRCPWSSAFREGGLALGLHVCHPLSIEAFHRWLDDHNFNQEEIITHA